MNKPNILKGKKTHLKYHLNLLLSCQRSLPKIKNIMLSSKLNALVVQKLRHQDIKDIDMIY